MSEIVSGDSFNTSTTNYTPVKQYCRETGDMCELATDFGYCKLTSCFKRSYSDQCLSITYHYGMCVKEVKK